MVMITTLLTGTEMEDQNKLSATESRKTMPHGETERLEIRAWGPE